MKLQNVRARCSKPARRDVARDDTVIVTSLRTAVCRLFGSSENSVLKNYKKEQKIIAYFKFKRHVMLMQYYAIWFTAWKPCFFSIIFKPTYLASNGRQTNDALAQFGRHNFTLPWYMTVKYYKNRIIREGDISVWICPIFLRQGVVVRRLKLVLINTQWSLLHVRRS